MTLFFSKSLMPLFLEYVKEDLTNKNVETKATLAGKKYSLQESKNDSEAYVVTYVIIPDQNQDANNCSLTSQGADKISDFLQNNKLMRLGCIHTHPSQDVFMSSVDLHTQLGVQLLYSNAISVVYSGRKKETKYYTLTKDGIDALKKCNLKGFHDHTDEIEFYTNHKNYECISYSPTFVDMRRKYQYEMAMNHRLFCNREENEIGNNDFTMFVNNGNSTLNCDNCIKGIKSNDSYYFSANDQKQLCQSCGIETERSIFINSIINKIDLSNVTDLQLTNILPIIAFKTGQALKLFEAVNEQSV